MKFKGVCAAALFAGAMLVGGVANATTVDITKYVDTVSGEKDADGTWNINGVNVTFGATNYLLPSGPYGGTPSAYFDYGGAGAGVCQQTFTPTGTIRKDTNSCRPSSDDNVTGTTSYHEVLQVSFDNPLGINNIELTSEGHKIGDYAASHNFDAGDLVDISTDGGATWIAYAIGVGTGKVAGFFQLLTGEIWFRFNNEQFYLSKFDTTAVPVPGALPLLASGIAGLGYLARRRKSKAAA